MTSKHADLLNALDEMHKAERDIVDRVWKSLGISTYDAAKGRAIDELVAETIKEIAGWKHENSLLRDLARKHESDRETAELYERLLTDIGKSVGCGHIDERLPSCVSQAVEGKDDLQAFRAAVLAAAPNLCWRKCHDCSNTALHVDSVTPWVLCRACGSQDTRLMLEATKALRGEAE